MLAEEDEADLDNMTVEELRTKLFAKFADLFPDFRLVPVKSPNSPVPEDRRLSPLVVTPPQINKYYALDLSSDKSMVRFLLESGIQPFCVSWRNPTEAIGIGGWMLMFAHLTRLSMSRAK